MSGPLKLSLAGGALAVLIVTIALSSLLVIGKRQRQSAMIARDRALASMLAGLRDQHRELDFATLRAFVEASDKLHSGLVYALQVDTGGRLVRGAVNTSVFTDIDPAFARHARAGRSRLLASLAEGRIERQGLIKEFELAAPSGRLRLGFDLRRSDGNRRQRVLVGLLLLGGALLLGAGAGALLGFSQRRRIRPLIDGVRAAARGKRIVVRDQGADELGRLVGALRVALEAPRDRTDPLSELYLSAPIARRIRRTDDPRTLPVEERAVCILSFSLCGFEEQLRAAASPRAAMALLNDYLAPAIEAIVEEQGVVVALRGAELQAIWGAPDDAEQGELHAVRAALRARDAVRSTARRHEVAGKPTLTARGAVTCGRAAVGNIGSAHRLAYAPIGEVVENGERGLETASAGQVLVDAVTLESLGDRVETVAHDELERPGGDPLPLFSVERVVGS